MGLKFGQFKPPFGWERFVPDHRILGVERAKVIDRLIPAGSLVPAFARDYGVQIFGEWDRFNLNYEFTAMTGNGANNPLTLTNAPLLVSRISFKKPYSLLWNNQSLKLLLQLAYAYRQNNFLAQQKLFIKTFKEKTSV